MNDFILQPTQKSLEVKCTPGEISLSGNSILADPKVFFDPIFKWIEEYIEQPKESTVINLKFEYVDTASVQRIFDVLKKLRELKKKELEVKVNWYYEMDDPELLELGEIMDGRLGLEFNYINY